MGTTMGDIKSEHETAQERGGGEDSDATAKSTSDEDANAEPAQPAPAGRYGLRKKRGTPIWREELIVDELGASGRKRKKSGAAGKQTAKKEKTLLHLAQVANSGPGRRKPKQAKEAVEAQPVGPIPAGNEPAVPRTEAPNPIMDQVMPQEGDLPVSAPGDPAQPAAQDAALGQNALPPADQGNGEFSTQFQAAPLMDLPVLTEDQIEQKLNPLQIRAWILSGQPYHLPGFVPGPLQHILMGARWQLDLRTGERLEEQPPPHMSLAQFAGQQMGIPGSFPTRPGGSYGLGSYVGNLPITGLGQQASPTGPYTALLGPGVLPGQFQGASQARKRQRSSTASDLADLPDIPLRRRGRPAGDGAGSAANPLELQERRMQANRAAASRSHFRRKREMELLDKDCAIYEVRLQELRASLANLLQQEEQLTMHQATIREQIIAGVKPSEIQALPQILPQGYNPEDPAGGLLQQQPVQQQPVQQEPMHEPEASQQPGVPVAVDTVATLQPDGPAQAPEV